MEKLNTQKIKISELREDVNYIMFNFFNFGIKELQFSNKLFEAIKEYENKSN